MSVKDFARRIGIPYETVRANIIVLKEGLKLED